MDFRVLGPVEVRLDGTLLPLGRARERFVLATLLLNAGRLITADTLIQAIWTDPPPTARAQLHNLISGLRRRLPDPEVLRSRPAGYELDLERHTFDLAEFRRLTAEARAEIDDARTVTLLDEALALWRGPALADVDDELTTGIRAALAEELLAAQEARLTALQASGRNEDVLRATLDLLEEHPFRESLLGTHMLALAESGRRADALAVYRQTYRRFVDELGVEPGAALRHLEQQILRDRVRVTDVLPRQLPLPVSQLTGQDKLLGEVVDALRAGPARVVLLTGPGGVGKTTVALAAAQQVSDDFPDGQLFAELRGDAHAVAGRFLRALGVDGASVPDDPDERISLYRSLLAERRMLVVLDNATTEADVRPLIPGTDNCRTVVTSRQRLDALVGAARWQVPVLTPADALALLADAIGRDRVEREPLVATGIAEACARLPLALTIAAARLAAAPHWTLREFHDRLTGERTRLDELKVGDLDVRASIAVSYDALSLDAKALLRRLSLVATGEWPAWVADGPLDELTQGHLVAPVRRDSLGQNRFRLHDLVADFAAELADDSDVVTTLEGWLALAAMADERIPHGVIRREPPTNLPVPHDLARDHPEEWFEVERRSLADAVTLAARYGHADLAGRIALRLSGFLWLRAYDEDWDTALRTAIEAVQADGLDGLLVRLLDVRFEVSTQLHRHADLPRIAAAQHAAAIRLGDRRWEVSALRHTGRAALRLDQTTEAIAVLKRAVRLARGLSEEDLSACLASLGWAQREAGRPEEALPLLEESLAIDQRVGETFRTGLRLYHYGIALTDAGRLADAEKALHRAMVFAVNAGDDSGRAYVGQALADIDIRLNRLGQARTLLTQALRVHESRGDQDGIATTLRSLAHLAQAGQRHDEAAELLKRSLAIWRRLGAHIEMKRTQPLP